MSSAVDVVEAKMYQAYREGVRMLLSLQFFYIILEKYRINEYKIWCTMLSAASIVEAQMYQAYREGVCM